MTAAVSAFPTHHVGTTNPPAPSTSTTASNPNEIRSTIAIPSYSTLFPFINIYKIIQTSLLQLPTTSNNLDDLFHNVAFFQNPITLKTVDQQIVNQLSQHPVITLSEKQTGLTRGVLQEVYTLSTELHLTIEEGIALYWEGSLDETRSFLSEKCATLGDEEKNKNVARELYFYERSCLFKSILLVIKHRIAIVEDKKVSHKEWMISSDTQWLQNGMIPSILKTIQELTVMAVTLKSERNLQQQQQQQHSSSIEYPFLDMILEQRQMATECLFYILYHTQGTGVEIGGLLDITRDLSNLLMLIDTKVNDWSETCRKEGHSQLLQCVNTLLVTCLVSLDNTHELWDRNTHDTNGFGIGNALLPPPECNVAPEGGLEVVHIKLTESESCDGWSKKEIWGWLSSAYALLVFPHYSTSSDRNVLSEVEFHQCLSCALTTRAFWFARCGVLSSFVPTQPLFPFLTTVLSEFTSHYLFVVSSCGELPISQAQWRRDKIEEIELRRVQEEQNRQLMGFLSGNMRNSFSNDNLYKIDFSTRPDCLEDIMSLVIHLCHVFPSCSAHMWHIPKTTDTVVLTLPPIVSQLQVMSQEDNSVLSWYFHYLSILTFHSEQAATNVFLLWTSTASNHSWNIKRCVQAIQWYIHKLTQDSTVATPIPQTSTSSSNYYYGADLSANDNNSNNTPTHNSSKELLQPDGIFFLSSILELLTHLLLRCPDMQSYILRSTDDELSCLLSTLFKLLGVVPNKQDVFRTISALVQQDRKACLEAWVLLEESQVLPTWTLSQYPIVSYPNALLPLRKNQDSILYEIEHSDGSYPCTEEFLGLVYTLVTYGGCPSSLGGERRRPGIAPYIEYITIFLLPKVMSSSMHYDSSANKYRLISKLLDVLLATLKRFILPTQESLSPLAPVTKESLQQIQFAFYKLLQSSTIGLTSSLHFTQFTNDDLDEMTAILHDFKDDSISVPIHTPSENVSILNLPRPKTPAFSVLSNLLACHDYQLLYSMLYLLTEHSSNPSNFFHQQTYDHLSIALLLLEKDYPRDCDTTSPTPRMFSKENAGSMVLSKFSSIYSIPQLQHVPCHEEQRYDFVSYFDLVSWKERTISNVLSILTHVVIREQTFASLLQSTGVTSTIIPVLRFQDNRRSVLSTHGTPGALDMHQVSITSRSSQLWMAASGAKHIFHHSSNPILSLVEYMSYTSLSPSSKYPSTITTLSLNLFSYLCSTVPWNEISSMMYPREYLIPYAFGKHLSLREDDSVKRLVIMKLLLSPPSLSTNFLTSPNNPCVVALLDILNKHDFLSLEDDSSLSLFHQSYQLLYKLTTASSNNFISITLRKCDFWYRHIRFYGRQLIQKKDMLLPSDGYHTLAWLFKGFVNELFWSKVNSTNHDYELQQYHRLLNLLLLPDGDDEVSIMQSFLFFLPLSSSIPPISSPPSFLSPESISQSTIPLSSHIGQGEAFFTLYQLVDITALLYSHTSTNSTEKELIQTWSWDWNTCVSLSCASTHLCHALEMTMAVLSLTWSEKRVDLITGIIEKMLLRMMEDVSAGGISTYSYLSFLPLSTSILSLVDILVSTTATSHNTMQLEDVLFCSVLLAKLIASCPAISMDNNYSDCYEQCISRLSSSLSSLLTIALTLAQKQGKNGDNFLSCYMTDVLSRLGPMMGNHKMDMDFVSTMFMNAASSLSFLVSRQQQSSPNSNIMNCRVCVRYILKFFNALESPSIPPPQTFLYRLFVNDRHAKARLTNLLTLITEYDLDICTSLLQQIAMCQNGSTMLFQAGASTALVQAAHKATLHHPKNFYMTESYGAVQLDPPGFFESHLILLTTMLTSSSLSQDNSRSLMKDATQFLTWYFPIGDKLLRSFPRNIGITNEYLFLLSIIAPVICCDVQPQDKKDDVLSTIKRRVIDLAYHVAAYPLPISVLPSLPRELLILEQQQQHQSKFGHVTVSANHCWWDLLTDSDHEQISLPYPFSSLPSSSCFGISNNRHSLPINTKHSASKQWTQEKYFLAISAMKSLENALLFLKQHVTSSLNAPSSPFEMNLNGISIAKGLCRCVELCRNIQCYSNSANNNNIIAESSEPWKRIEYKSLISLGTILKRCSNLFLGIIDTYLRLLLSENNTMFIKAANMPTTAIDLKKRTLHGTIMDDFSKPVSLVLGHLKIESMGIDNDSNKQDMSKLATIILNIKDQVRSREKL